MKKKILSLTAHLLSELKRLAGKIKVNNSTSSQKGVKRINSYFPENSPASDLLACATSLPPDGFN